MLYNKRTNTFVPSGKFPDSAPQAGRPAPQPLDRPTGAGDDAHESGLLSNGTKFDVVLGNVAFFMLLGAVLSAVGWLTGECLNGFSTVETAITLGPVVVGGIRGYFKAEHRYGRILLTTVLTSTLIATPAWLIHDLFVESSPGFLILYPLFPLFYISYTALPILIAAAAAYAMQKLLH